MSKYIIEIKPEYEDSFKGLMILGAKDSNLFVDTLAVENLEELNSDYINEHFGQLQDEAYKRGINDGSLDVKQRVEGAYQRGLDDAWEAARKIVRMPEGDLLNIFTECYSAVCTALQVLLKYDASEAIEKLKAYEEQKADDEIKVGDEVVWTEDEDVVIIVTLIYTSNGIEWCDGICRDGKVYQIITEHARKTGRHFDIDKILEGMKE